jgi:hypothetical protein
MIVTQSQKTSSTVIFALIGLAVFGMQVILGRYLGALCLTEPIPSYMPIAVGLTGLLHWLILGVLVVLDLFKANFRRSVAYFVAVLLCYVVNSAIVQFNSKMYNIAHHRSFSRDHWKTAKNDMSSRLSEVDDLLQSKLLIGRSHSQVQELLGPPDNVQDGNFFVSAPE